jgi:hypothetical protein
LLGVAHKAGVAPEQRGDLLAGVGAKVRNVKRAGRWHAVQGCSYRGSGGLDEHAIQEKAAVGAYVEEQVIAA